MSIISNKENCVQSRRKKKQSFDQYLLLVLAMNNQIYLKVNLNYILKSTKLFLSVADEFDTVKLLIGQGKVFNYFGEGIFTLSI